MQYAGVRFTPPGEVEIKFATLFTAFTQGTSGECDVYIHDDEGGLPGTQRYHTTVVAAHQRWNFARITPPVTCDSDFWIVVKLPPASPTLELWAYSDESMDYGTRNAIRAREGGWQCPSSTAGDLCIRARVSISGVEQELYPAEIVTLNQNRPNPVRNETAICYALSHRTGVELAIYDVTGKLVRSLVNDIQESGVQRVMWDRRDDQGERVHSGVYFYKLNTDTGGSFSKAMTVL